MKANWFLVLLIITLKVKNVEAPQYCNVWVVWNIGQGQWVTHILPDSCIHYDMGGEFNSFRTLKKSLLSHCARKTNRLNLSHWDYDHFFNVPAASKIFPQFCWENTPTFDFQKKKAQDILKLQIPLCKKLQNDFKTFTPEGAKNTNESSAIFFDDRVLMTGDSPIKIEKLWVNRIENLSTTRVYILGHHGSRTSSGEGLLAHLPELKMAVSSARYSKYGHPHLETLARIAMHQVPVLKTEDWGNIWFVN